MNQLEKNKEELLEMMEHLAHDELSWDDICNLATLRDAYKALCLAGGEEHTEATSTTRSPSGRTRGRRRRPEGARGNRKGRGVIPGPSLYLARSA